MGTDYSQLDLDERIEVFRLNLEGRSYREIGRMMGRHHTTIIREVKRNSLMSGYKPGLADHMAWVRRKRASRLERLRPLYDYVVDRLAMGWSPEQIAGRLRQTGSQHAISHESIYRFIFSRTGRKLKLSRYLVHRKARRGLRYFKAQNRQIPEEMSIANRPAIVEKQEEFGHWEGDLVQFRTQRGALLNVTERITRFCLLSSLKTKRAVPTGKAVADALKHLPQTARRSITFDRGSEFADHQTIKDKIGSDIWFCDPHSPWQRGSVENMNGIIRRDMPRRSDITDYTEMDIEMLQLLINSTPRKCLNFKTPQEAFCENVNGALEM